MSMRERYYHPPGAPVLTKGGLTYVWQTNAKQEDVEINRGRNVTYHSDGGGEVHHHKFKEAIVDRANDEGYQPGPGMVGIYVQKRHEPALSK